MSEENKTNCECPLAGFCSRHGIKKNNHWHKLCQNHEGYFQMWEECKGPGQHFTDCTESEPPKKEPVKENSCKFCNKEGCFGTCRNTNKLPSKVDMAKNLAKATVAHAKTGFNEATPELQKERMDTCIGCEFYIPEKDRCAKCGCYLSKKIKWKSSGCPIGKW